MSKQSLGKVSMMGFALDRFGCLITSLVDAPNIPTVQQKPSSSGKAWDTMKEK